MGGNGCVGSTKGYAANLYAGESVAPFKRTLQGVALRQVLGPMVGAQGSESRGPIQASNAGTDGILVHQLNGGGCLLPAATRHERQRREPTSAYHLARLTLHGLRFRLGLGMFAVGRKSSRQVLLHHPAITSPLK